MIRHPLVRCLSLGILCTALLAPSPARAWQSAIGGTGKAPDGEFAGAIALDGNRDVTVAGYLLNKAPDDPDSVFTTAKFSGATGAVIWRKEQAGRRDDATAVVLTATGDAVVAGRVGGKFAVIRHAAGDGSELSRYITVEAAPPMTWPSTTSAMPSRREMSGSLPTTTCTSPRSLLTARSFGR